MHVKCPYKNNAYSFKMTTITFTIHENVDADKLKYLLQTYRSISSLVSEDIKVSSLIDITSHDLLCGCAACSLPSESDSESDIDSDDELYKSDPLAWVCRYYRREKEQKEKAEKERREREKERMWESAWGGYNTPPHLRREKAEKAEKEFLNIRIEDIENEEIDDKLKAELELFDAVFGYD